MKRRLAVFAVLLLGAAGLGGWYYKHTEDQALADREMSEIPTDEYEQWMQELGYVD